MSLLVGPCMCGATDCPSCGPAQGYSVVRRGARWVNPEEDFDPPEPDDYAADRAADRYERNIVRNYP